MNFNHTFNSRTLLTGALMTFSLVAFSQAYEGQTGKLKPYSVEPTENEQILSCRGISSVSITYPGGGEIGVEEINIEGKFAVLTRNGELVQNIDLTSPNAFKIASNNPNCIIITFPIQTLPGEYTLTVPDGIIKMSEDTGTVMPETGEDEEEKDEASYINSRYELTFSIVESPDFTFTPVPGAVKPEQMNVVTITYPEGSDITLGDASLKPSLLLHFGTHSDEESETNFISSYNVAVEGNNVILTITDKDAVTPVKGNAAANWDYIEIPQDCWTVNLNGKAYPVPTFRLDKYNVTLTVASDFDITPNPESTDFFKGVDLKTMTIRYPETWKPAAACKIGGIIGYLRQTGVSETSGTATSGYIAGTYIVTKINTTERLITFSMQDPEENSYANNPILFESGYYAVSLNGRIFTNNNYTLSQSFAFPGYLVKGKESVAPLALYLDNMTQDEEGNIVSPLAGFTNLEIEWPFDLNLSKADAVLSLSRDNEIIKEIPVSDFFNPQNNRYMSVTLSKSPVREPGHYTLSLPEGVFTQESYGNYPNEKIDFNFSIPGNPELSVTPVASSEINSPQEVNDLSEFTFSYPTGTTITLPSTFSEEKISIDIINVATGEVTQTFHPSNVTVENSDVIANFNPILTLATGKEYCYRLTLPTSTWNLKSRYGINYANTGWTGYYTIPNPMPGHISLDSSEGPLPRNTNLGVIDFTSPVQPVSGVIADAPKAYLLNYAENIISPLVVAEYEATLIDENTVRFSTEKPIIYLGADFNFVIPANGPVDYLYCGNDYPESIFPFSLDLDVNETPVVTDDSVVTVVTIDGKVLLREAPVSELSTLPSGLYIINNRKVVIR